MSDERLAEMRRVAKLASGRNPANGAVMFDLLAEVDRLRTENAELEAADDASYAMRQLVFDLASLDRASQIGRRMRFNLTDLIRKAQAAVERWREYADAG